MKEKVSEFLCSSALRNLLCRCNNLTVLDILGKKNSEAIHSAMIAWILTDPTFADLNIPSITLLLRLIASKAISAGQNKELEALITSTCKTDFAEVEREKTIGNNKIDLYIEVGLPDDLNIRIWLENKISALPGKEQLKKYFDSVRKNKEEEEFLDVFVYLSPSYTNLPDHDSYIHISYQELYDYVLIPLLNQLQIVGLRNKSTIYLEEYMDALTSYDETFSPIVRSKSYLASLKIVYDYYLNLLKDNIDILELDDGNELKRLHSNEKAPFLRDIYNEYYNLFLASIMQYGTEEERNSVKNRSRIFEIRYEDEIVLANGYTRLAKEVFRTLLRKGVKAEELLKKLGRTDNGFTGFDNRVADTRITKGADSCYSPGTIRRSGIYISNQWSSEKVASFISRVKRFYPSIKISRR